MKSNRVKTDPLGNTNYFISNWCIFNHLYPFVSTIRPLWLNRKYFCPFFLPLIPLNKIFEVEIHQSLAEIKIYQITFVTIVLNSRTQGLTWYCFLQAICIYLHHCWGNHWVCHHSCIPRRGTQEWLGRNRHGQTWDHKPWWAERWRLGWSSWWGRQSWSLECRSCMQTCLQTQVNNIQKIHKSYIILIRIY